MERKKHNIRLMITGLYAIFFATYIYIGFQPVKNTYEISSQLIIPAINLSSPVTNITLSGKTLTSPESIVGAYVANPTKTLLIAHSTTAFKNLGYLSVDELIYYKNQTYRVVNQEILPKNKVNMQNILSTADQTTLVLMTCAGELLDNHDATHRLIVTAELTLKE